MQTRPAHYQLSVYHLNSSPSPPQPAGCVTATPLLLLLFENLLRHFQNSASGGTEPKEAAYAVTGLNLDKGMWWMGNCQLSMVNCEWATILPPPKNTEYSTITLSVIHFSVISYSIIHFSVVSYSIIRYPFFNYQLFSYPFFRYQLFNYPLSIIQLSIQYSLSSPSLSINLPSRFTFRLPLWWLSSSS